LHEGLITEEESQLSWLRGDYYVIQPLGNYGGVKPFTYSSINNKMWLTPDDLRGMI